MLKKRKTIIFFALSRVLNILKRFIPIAILHNGINYNQIKVPIWGFLLNYYTNIMNCIDINAQYNIQVMYKVYLLY